MSNDKAAATFHPDDEPTVPVPDPDPLTNQEPPPAPPPHAHMDEH